MDRGTSFYTLYCSFLGRITDDMYMELTLEETFEIMEEILLAVVPKFKFPRFRLKVDPEVPTMVNDLGETVSKGEFADTLTLEEIDIYVELMVIEWYNRQLATTRLVKQKYSASDFKMTSQAAHMQRLQSLIENKIKENNRMQAMYNRRIIDSDGYVVPNYDGLYSRGNKMLESVHGTLSVLGRGGSCG